MIIPIFIGFLALILAIYAYITKDWGKYEGINGLKEYTPTFPFGSPSSWSMLTGKKSFLDNGDDAYEHIPPKGALLTWLFSYKSYLVKDMDLIKAVLVKDFDHFVDRREFSLDEEVNKYFMRMLTMLKGDDWKLIRSIITPIFTSGKLKKMTNYIHTVGDEFVHYLTENQHKDLDFKNVMTRYTLGSISTCSMGIESNAFDEKNNPLYDAVMKATNGGKPTLKVIINFFFILAFPRLAKWLKVSFVDREAAEFFVKVIRDTMTHRKENNFRRNDMIDLLLDEMKGVGIEDSEEDKLLENTQYDKDAKLTNVPEKFKKFSNEEMELMLVSNALVIFFAGFDTSSTIMALASLFLAKNPGVQDKLYEEVAEAIEENGGKESLDYSKVMELEYLDKVVMETLRYYPLTPLERQCVKDYKLPGTDVVIEKGNYVVVTSRALMRDPQYYPYPNEFNPDNFDKENVEKRNPYAFLAFGQGPRNCIGMRFALLQVKISLIRLIYGFQVKTCPTTIDEPIPDPKSQSGIPKGGVYLKVEKRN